jgi:NADH:ubiquinone oxidoreductase subunit 5 (subunit L)/multisubunit Na+/H+ antiporter MnhA subunit
MTIPLIVLAAGSAVVGLLGIPHLSVIEHWLDPVIDKPAGAEAAHGSIGLILALMVVSVAVAVLGIYLGRLFYVNRPQLASIWAEKLKPLYRLSVNKWYWDYLLDVKGVEAAKALNNAAWRVDAAVVDGGVNGSAWLTRLWARISGWWDKWVIDLAVNMTGWVARAGSWVFRALQTGFWQNYVMFFTVALFLVLFYYAFPAIKAGIGDLLGIFGGGGAGS